MIELTYHAQLFVDFYFFGFMEKKLTLNTPWIQSSFLTQKLSFFFSFIEARGKLKKLALPLLLALKFKSAVILPIVFTLLTLVSLKALKLGFIAILLAGE